MIQWLILFSILYLGMLAFLSYRSRQVNTSADSFMFGGAKIGVLLGFMTVAATLFSTFTIQGMPDFFRNHGVGSWIFLAVSDGIMVFVIVWFGFYLRRKTAQKGFRGMAGLLQESYGHKMAGYIYFIGAFLFLVPYVAIQIRGISIFLSAIFPDVPFWVWSVSIVIIMLLYSETGGLKAIMHADVMQGILLMIVVWIIAVSCLDQLGGVSEMFRQVGSQNEALLSVPGPNGLFSVQFLVASAIGIVFIPITQPQVSTRIVIMRDLRATHRMAVAVGVFAILVILPTMPIGMYGALKYPEAPTAEFLSQVLLFDQHGFVAAAAVIGLIAAAISTSDSQIFALGSEFRSLLSGDEKQVLNRTKLAIVIFAIACMIFAILSSDQLVMLARLSFTGTALMGPMILAAILSDRRPSPVNIVYPAIALVLFIGSQPQVGLIEPVVAGIRMDLLLSCAVALLTLLTTLLHKPEIQLNTQAYKE